MSIVVDAVNDMVNDGRLDQLSADEIVGSVYYPEAYPAYGRTG